MLAVAYLEVKQGEAESEAESAIAGACHQHTCLFCRNIYLSSVFNSITVLPY